MAFDSQIRDLSRALNDIEEYVWKTTGLSSMEQILFHQTDFHILYALAV
jgi:hypothetical protein